MVDVSELRKQYKKRNRVIKIKEPNMDILKDEQYIKRFRDDLMKYREETIKRQQISDKTLLSRFNF